ncbi:hypothetical protein AGR4A_pAt10284 [Agrobacterium tumefaciens str. B6]|uniref:Uncharacterized protein n=1 Tax=Agrobacterium tumefaciens str. B6 TaxID=1183423 RepID=A0A822VBQ0_AGRTU|nr:hypothetical protein AGR4A_pAt10284 [Agrobacterium tumefaciens str. B6]
MRGTRARADWLWLPIIVVNLIAYPDYEWKTGLLSFKHGTLDGSHKHSTTGSSHNIPLRA